MKSLLLLCALACVVLFPTLTLAADTTATQTVTIAPALLPATDGKLLSSITPLKARALLDKICKAPKDPVEPCDLDAVHTFGLINLLVWDNTANPAKITSTWFVYHPKSGVLTSWSQADLTTRNRLYGAHTVALMMVQVHAPTKDLAGTYTIGEKKRVLENTQSLQSLISLAGLGAPAGGGFTPPQGCNANGCDMFGYSIVTLSFDAADLTIKSTVGPVATLGAPPTVVPPVAPVGPGGAPVPVIPAPGAPVPAPAVAAAPGAAPVAPLAPLPVVPPVVPAAPGGAPVPVIPAPGAPAPAPVPPVAPAPGVLVPVAGSQPLADANAGTQTSLPDFTAINEAKQWWDISIAIPIKKVSELQLNSVNNTVAPTNINRQNAFAVLDLFPIKRDLVGAAPTLVPHPLIGVSLASQPLHTILAALGMGFSYGDLYVGAILQKSQDVTGLAAGSTATPAQLAAATRYTYKPQFSIGINVSIKGALSALKK